MKKVAITSVRILLTSTIIWMISFLLESCKKEPEFHIDPVESVNTEGILIKNYLLNLKNLTDKEGKDVISQLETGINFSNLRKYSINSEESLIISDIKNEESFLHSTDDAKAIFIRRGEKIISSNIYAFSNPSEKDDIIIKSIIEMSFRGENYNGKISVYAISGKIIYFNEAKNGRIFSSGYTQPKLNNDTQSAKGARPNQCTSWYMIYRSNGVIVGTEYLYTVCDCETARIGVPSETGAARLRCGGGGDSGNGGGGSGPNGGNPPSSPRNGDEFNKREQDGRIVKYRAINNVWTIISVTLPLATVQGNSSNYPFLVSDGAPEDGQAVDGPDTFMYIYSAWSGSWFAAEPYAYSYVLRGPDRPINLPQKLKNCFGNVPADSKYQYSVTMYADQPSSNSRDKINTSNSRMVGHTYLGFSQYDQTTGSTVTVVGGFYTVSTVSAVLSNYAGGTGGAWGDDGGTTYDAALRVDMTADQFRSIVDNLNNVYGQHAPTYHLTDNNCTTFATNLLSPYISLPAGTGYLPALGTGINPADMVEDLRSAAGTYGGKLTLGNNLTSPSTNCN